MRSKQGHSDSTSRSSRTSAQASAPSKRFRIEKLEERIAPKKGGKGTHNCGDGGSSGDSGASSGFSGSVSIF